MKLSFATLGCPAWNLEQIVRNAQTLGFDGVELRGIKGEHVGPEERPEFLTQLRARFQQAGVAVAAIMGYSTFTLADPAQRQESLRIARLLIGTAQQLGCPTLRVFGGGVAPTDDRAQAIARVRAGLRELAPVAEQAGVRLALETHDDWCVGANLRAVLQAVNSPAVGACWDIANSHFIEPTAQTFAASSEASRSWRASSRTIPPR